MAPVGSAWPGAPSTSATAIAPITMCSSAMTAKPDAGDDVERRAVRCCLCGVGSAGGGTQAAAPRPPAAPPVQDGPPRVSPGDGGPLAPVIPCVESTHGRSRPRKYQDFDKCAYHSRDVAFCGRRHVPDSNSDDRKLNMAGNLVARSIHDLTAGAWFGGSLMGAIGLNGATAEARDPAERTRLSSLGWKKWAPVQTAAFGAHFLSGLAIMWENKGRMAKQDGVTSLTRRQVRRHPRRCRREPVCRAPGRQGGQARQRRC